MSRRRSHETFEVRCPACKLIVMTGRNKGLSTTEHLSRRPDVVKAIEAHVAVTGCVMPVP
jgi:hypothetical protein